MLRRSKKVEKAAKAYGLLQTSLKYQTKEFFENSTLHGVRYMAEKDRPFTEKSMWFCLVAVGAVAAFVIIGSLWEKFQTNPTITGLDTDFHNQQVLFPTVTICPLNAFSPELINETAFEEFAKGENEENLEDFLPVLKALPQLSYNSLGTMYNAILNSSENVRNKNLRQLAFKVGIKCNDLLEICKYKDEEITCCEFFMPLYSEHGLCYSFNTRYFSTASDEVRNENFNDLYETDKKWALQFVPLVSSRIFIHSIDEVSGYDFRPIFQHDVGYAVTLMITMKQTYTTDEAELLSVAQRKCIFPGERKLQYYKDDVYSFSQCMRQCRMERSNFFCRCIPPFYLPANAFKYRQCGIKDIICLLKHVGNITNIKACKHCELSCHNTVYDVEKFSKVMVPESNKREDFHISIEFLTWPIVRYKKEILFGWVDLLVSFGGIAGLFLGFSLLSGVEIIYYFTMRAACMIYKNREELYEIQREKGKRPKTHYDLSMKPKLKKSDRLKSLSMSHIHTVRPVESTGSSQRASIEVKAFDSPKVPIKNAHIVGQLNAINRKIEEMANARKPFNVYPQRQIVFRPIQFAPYAHKIKPLDKKFRKRSQSEGPEIIFDGYLA